MTSSLRIRRNVMTTVAAFFVNIALIFVGYKLVVEQGGTAALGLWSALSAAIYVIRLGDVGMGSAAERHVAATDAQRDPARARGYLDTALLLNAVLFLCLALVGWLVLRDHIAWIVPDDGAAQSEAKRILPLMLTGFVILNVANVISGALRGLHFAYLAAYVSVAASLVQMIVVVMLVPHIGVEGLAWGQLAQNLVVGCTAWWLFNKRLATLSCSRLPIAPRTASFAMLRELFGFSLKAQAVNLANGLLEPASKLLVGHSSGISTLGVYEMAYKIVALPRNAIVSGVLGMTPAMTRLLTSEPAQAAQLYRRARRLVVLSTGSVLSLVVICSPIASYFLLDRVDPILIGFIAALATGFWFNAAGAPAYALGFAAGRMGANFVSSITSLSCVLLVGWCLQLLWPTNGPVIASAVALATGGMFILWRNERLLRNAAS